MNMSDAARTVYDPEGIKASFEAAVRQTLSNVGANEAMHICKKIVEILGGWNPAFIASPEMLAKASETVFTDEKLRDWIFNTKFVFYMKVSAGSGPLALRALLRDMAIAASEDMDTLDMLSDEERAAFDEAVVTPKELLEDLPTASQTLTVLAANTWLVVPMLLFAFMGLDHALLQPPEPPKARPAG